MGTGRSGARLRLEGLHHITMITGDAQKNVDFCVGVLGLRMVKKTVNFDAPDMYHLFYGDSHGSPGSILTWFEIREARAGRAGAGMVHLIELGVPSADSLGFWEERLARFGYDSQRDGDRLLFKDYDGLDFALVPATLGNPPLQAVHPEIPAEHAITGIEGARAYPLTPNADDLLLRDVFNFAPHAPASSDPSLADNSIPNGAGHAERVTLSSEYRAAGVERTFRWAYDDAPSEPGIPGAGTVHHIAWCSRDEDHLAWQERERSAGLYVTPVQDRDYFEAIYARVPSGVLFEIATMSPGFAVDEHPDHLGEELRVPKMHEALRDRIEQLLKPITPPSVHA